MALFEPRSFRTRIYAEAFSKDPEFYALYRTLELYRNFNSNSSLMLSTDADIFKYLKGSGTSPRK